MEKGEFKIIAAFQPAAETNARTICKVHPANTTTPCFFCRHLFKPQTLPHTHPDGPSDPSGKNIDADDQVRNEAWQHRRRRKNRCRTQHVSCAHASANGAVDYPGRPKTPTAQLKVSFPRPSAIRRSVDRAATTVIHWSKDQSILTFCPFFLSLTNVRNISTSLCQPQRKKSPTPDHTHIIIPQVPVNLGWFRSLFFFFPLSSLNKHICASQSHLLL